MRKILGSKRNAFDERTPMPTKVLGCFSYEMGYVVILGVAFCTLFSAFNATQSLQGTVNAKWGFWSLGLLYIVFSISNALVPELVIKIGEKASLLIGGATFVLFIASNIKVLVPTLMISAAICGFGAAVLWSGQGAFLVRISAKENVGKNSGIFFAFHQSSTCLGNLLGAILLSSGGVSNVVLFIIFTVIGIFGVSIFLALRNPPQTSEEIILRAENAKQPLSYRLFKSFTMFKDKRFLILVPFVIYSGMSQGYIYGTFATELGKFWLGWVMASFGASNALCSTMVGKVLSKIGCKGTIALSTVCFLICSITMAATPTEVLQQNYGVLFMCAIFLGAADAGYNTTIYAIWGAYWPKTIEMAFGAFRFIQGSAIALFLGIGPVVNLTQATVLIVIFLFAGLTAVVICDRIIQPMDIKPGQEENNEVNFTTSTHTEMASALDNGDHYTNGTDVDDTKSVPLDDSSPISGAA